MKPTVAATRVPATKPPMICPDFKVSPLLLSVTQMKLQKPLRPLLGHPKQ
jgi:hypothetical protein